MLCLALTCTAEEFECILQALQQHQHRNLCAHVARSNWYHSKGPSGLLSVA